MLRQARDNCEGIVKDVFHVQADNFALPLADQSVDLLLTQNTMPCFAEFARVCRPGAIIIYVDSSAGWVADLAKRLVEKHRLFERVTGERVNLGFYVLAQKAGDANNLRIISVKGETKQQRMAGLLRCPLDKSKVLLEQDHLYCEHYHQYPIQDGFPVMLGKSAISTAK